MTSLDGGNFRLPTSFKRVMERAPPISPSPMEKATELLIARGYTREWAEALLMAQDYAGLTDNPQDWIDQILKRETPGNGDEHRKQILELHHQDGIPPSSLRNAASAQVSILFAMSVGRMETVVVSAGSSALAAVSSSRCATRAISANLPRSSASFSSLRFSRSIIEF
jgi:hypothetical protein